MEFEWSEAKAAGNIAKHQVAFQDVLDVFRDIYADAFLDRSMNYGEDRFATVGWPTAFCTMWPTPNVGIRYALSLPERRPGENSEIMTETDKDRELRLAKVRAMSDEEVVARALADPDAQPITDEWLAVAKRVPRVKILRRALGLTQEQFAERYLIPLGTLRDWEQGRSEPDQATQAYLKVIAREPETVARALAPRNAA